MAARRAESSHLGAISWGIENKLKVIYVFNFSKPASSDGLPPARLHCLNPFKTTPPIGNQECKHPRPWGHFSFKLLYGRYKWGMRVPIKWHSG